MMEVKGVCYDVGRVMLGANWRPKFDPKTVKRELEIIKNDLHANAVRICGLDLERLELSGDAALSLGLDVWFSPEMWDRPQDETLNYLVEAAKRAEGLRLKHGGRVIFSVGSELTLFMQGILKGDNIFERMQSPSFLEKIKSGVHNTILNEFLNLAVTQVKEYFHGPLTYFSVGFEKVKWENFDFVGVDLYRDARTRDTFDKLTSSFLVQGKPLIIGETGCCTYRGAEKLGGLGFTISFGMVEAFLGEQVESPEFMPRTPELPVKVDGHYVRDELLQAHEVVGQLKVFDEVGATGAFVFTFVSPTRPFNPDQRYDMDMADFSLVKSYPEKEAVEEFIRMAMEQRKELANKELARVVLTGFLADVGKHGSTYPDMTWEPKESFRSVSKYFLEH